MGVSVNIYRKTQSEISDFPITDGNLIFETDKGDNSKIYLDVDTQRNVIGGKLDIVNTLSESEATTEPNVAVSTGVINELNSNLTATITADITIANSNGNNVKIACRNGVVTCDYPYGSLKSLPTGATVLGTIPEQFRPLYQVLTRVANLPNNNISVIAYPDGRLNAYNYDDAYIGNLNFGFGMSWIIND